MMSLTTNEKLRYQRQINLPQIGEAGQLKLKQSSVLVIGAGGLGSPLLLYLVASGIGRIGIIDADSVDISNLHRQILYTEHDLNYSKVELAKKRLEQLNSNCNIEIYNEKLNFGNAKSLFQQYDLIADGSDNFTTRYLVNDVCVQLQKPFSHASIFQFTGFCMLFQPNHACYRCVFPEPSHENLNCSLAGVLGSIVGVIATLQATQILHFLLQLKEFDFNYALQIDLLKFDIKRIKLSVEPECKSCQKKEATNPTMINEITVKELKQLLRQDQDIQLLDVREPFEYQQFHLPNSISIPLRELQQNVHRLQKNQPIIAICAAGVRSELAVTILKKLGYENVLNLKGGLYAWNAHNS